MSTREPPADLDALAQVVERLESALDDQAGPGSLTAAQLQDLTAACIKLYVRRLGAGEALAPIPDETAGAPTATELMIFATQLLAAGDLELFELGMWQSWGSSGAGVGPSLEGRADTPGGR